ncbi:hypothetical protein HPP92_016873 [Vanilla planifolia]|uniref:GrpE protein homolog n=1 Tax=Vanilla planifolia TaxID=51239 RepID=A0A835USH5_VANPL|nr:hypothetical protein HPP92_016873 [Vanilla planifolia]
MASILRSSSLLPLCGIRITSPETRRSLPSLPTKQRGQVRPLRINPSTCIAKAFRFCSFIPSAASRQLQETEETEAQEIEEKPTDDGAVVENIPVAEEKLTSTVMTSLEAYKEALADNDQSKVSEIEAFLQSIEDEKTSLEEKVASLSEEFLVEKDRILRISADFDNFRKRTEREKLSLVDNVRCEVLENLLPVLDNFERAKTQIKVETEGKKRSTTVTRAFTSSFWRF